MKFNYLGISQSLKLSILIENIHPISLYLNFTPNTLGCFGLTSLFYLHFVSRDVVDQETISCFVTAFIMSSA